MAPKMKDTEDTIDKPHTRRPQIVLRTLPPIVFTSPTSALTFQLTMSVPAFKPSRSDAPQLERHPSYRRDFGIVPLEEYGEPQIVKREFERVNQRVDEVKKDLQTARDVLDEKIIGLETRLTDKVQQLDDKMTGKFDKIDDKFDQQEKKFEARITLLQVNVHIAFESVEERFDAMDKRVDERFAKVDENFAKVDENFAKVDENFAKVDENFAKVDENFAKVDDRLDAIEDDIGEMKDDIRELKDDMKQIKQMLQHILAPGGAPPTPLPSASSQAPFLVNPPQVIVHAPPTPVAGPSSSRRHRTSSAARRDAQSISRGPRHERLSGVFRSIGRKVSKGFSILNNSKESLDQ